MEVRIKSTDYEMTPEIAAYLDEKIATLSKLVGDDETARCEVEIGRSVGHSQQGDVWKAEIVILRHGERLRAIAEEESVQAAIDIVKDEMLQQLRKDHGRNLSLTRRMAARLKRFARRGDIRSY